MYLWALRGRTGVRIAVAVTLIWLVAFLFVAYLPYGLVAALAYGLAVTGTAWLSDYLCRYREEVRFATNFAREHAFPSNRRNAGVTFRMQLAFSLFFLMLAGAPLLAPTPERWKETAPVFFLGYMFTMPGFVGVLHAVVRRWRCGPVARLHSD